jgi:hypothetical protein
MSESPDNPEVVHIGTTGQLSLLTGEPYMDLPRMRESGHENGDVASAPTQISAGGTV